MEKILIVELTLKWSHETLDSFGYQISQVAKFKNSLTKGKKKSIKVVNELKRKRKKKKGKTNKPYEAWIDTGRERKQVLWYFVME